MNPVAVDGILCLLVLVPIVCCRTVATNQEVADIALLHRMAAFIGNQRLIARYELACAAWSDLASTITDEDMQNLGAADAIEDLYMEGVLPTSQNVSRQRFTGRDAQTH